MKGISKGIFISILLIGLNTQVAYSALDIVKTYHSDWVESQYFRQNARIYVTANDGKTTFGGERVISLIPRPEAATFTLTINDNGIFPDRIGNDGTYTGVFNISTHPMSVSNLQLFNGERINIVVNLDGVDSGMATIIADYVAPASPVLKVSEEYFSPQSSFGKKDTTVISFQSSEAGSYQIRIDANRVPKSNIPTHTPNGTFTFFQTVSFEWNGFDQDGKQFLEGKHTIRVKVLDEARNESDVSTYDVWIDNTFPTKVYMHLPDDVFSPGASLGVKDTTHIRLISEESDSVVYNLSINGKILLGTGTPMGTGTGFIPDNGFILFKWGGQDESGILFDEGVYFIKLQVEDLAGNEAEVLAKVTIDNTPPRIEYFRDNSGGKPCYKDQEVRFILQASDWIKGNISVKAEGGIANGWELNLTDLGEGVYLQCYTVKETDVGTFTYSATFQDKAGNPATNNNNIFGTITFRGNEYSPAIGARIVRLKSATPEKGTFNINSNNITLDTSTMKIKADKIKKGDKVKIKTINNSYTWIASATVDGEVTVSNANLFFGFPISNYNNINKLNITTGARLKTKLKIGDEVTINLTAVNILSRLAQPTQTVTSILFKDTQIATGTMIVVYDAEGHVWLGTASSKGKFEISNANLYFGDLGRDYKRIEGIEGYIASFCQGGVGYADMGIVTPGISLYDDGLPAHQDIVSGDGVYSTVYVIKQTNDTTSYFYGSFAYLEHEATGIIKTEDEIIIDATPPVITDFGAFPGVFQVGSENVTIKYVLKEEADVTIEIWDTFSNLIRRLTPPIPNYGDNCSAVWDGKNEAGNLVRDGDYIFKINAVDRVGNYAQERVGVIKATTVKIKIIKLEIIPSIFTPSPQIKDNVDFWVDMHATVEATVEQLRNLGFGMDINNIYSLPYLLVNFTCYDAQGNELKPVSLPDLTSEVDTDPFTMGYPRYYGGSMGTETGWGVFPKLGTDLPDIGDENKGNDWDVLVPLQRLTENQYYIEWGVGIKDWEVPNGTYIVRMEVKLIGSCWKFIGYLRDTNNNPIAERWHQKPNSAYGYSRSSGPVDGRVEVTDSPVITPDNIAPQIISTDPGANTIHEPTENILKISAVLIDEGGSNLDLPLSTIILKNSNGMVIPGIQSNNGLDTIYWNLKEPLTQPGVYTIEVKPIDKAKNGLAAAPQKFTFTILDRVGPKILDILYDTNNEKGVVLKNKDSFGPNVITKFYVTLSENERGNSKIDFPASKIIIRNEATQIQDEPHRLFSGTRREEPTNENNGRIIYENFNLERGGTYTIWVVAWDKASPKANDSYSSKITFYISLIGYIDVMFNYPLLGTKTYLSIPPATKAYATATGIDVTTNTIAIRQGTITKVKEDYTAIDPIIEFWWFNNEHLDIKLDPPLDKEISLTMYYGHIELPVGVVEDDLAIWRYNGISWGNQPISGVNDIDKVNKKIRVTLPKYPEITLEDQYAIMYRPPKPVYVQYYHYEKGVVTCLEIPAATRVQQRIVVGTNTITAGTLTLTRAEYVVVEPVVQFYLNGVPVENRIEFDKKVNLIMYYTSNDVDKLTQRGLDETDLAIYGYDGTNWIKIINSNLVKTNKEISYSTKIIYEKYAIMYVVPEITMKPEVFEQSVYAYPNPVKNGKVTFRYDLIRDARVSVKIYTIMGDEVWSKEYSPTSPQGKQGSHGVYPSGNDAIIWNCENNAGKKVATELYIYTLTASDESGEVTVTKKLIVIQ